VLEVFSHCGPALLILDDHWCFHAQCPFLPELLACFQGVWVLGECRPVLNSQVLVERGVSFDWKLYSFKTLVVFSIGMRLFCDFRFHIE